jgi:hypothetical protein
MGDRSDAWFIYERAPGTITAKPANGKGYAAFLSVLLSTIMLGTGLVWFNRDLNPLILLLILASVIVTGVMLILGLALWKGRPAP